jgi:RNA-directed DNA polymerase
MKFKDYQAAFEKEASNCGYSEYDIKRCLDYAKVLFSNNVPVIYNTSHLCALVGYNKRYIKRAVVYTPYFYRDFKILKRNGKQRVISEPLPSLKEIQKWILENILWNVKVSPFAKAYRKKVSITENVRFHTNQPYILTLDLKDFFFSIKTDSVEKIFHALGYSVLISNLLAKLCTKENSLPQGAPTSPYLSNIFFKPADNAIADYCIPKKIRYTRYADDLSFSGDFDANELLTFVREVVGRHGLAINSEKTKLMSQSTRQSVTGIVVNKKAQVVFHKRNKLRQDIYYIKKFGLAEHMRHKDIKQANYLRHLIGKVNFVIQINPKDKEFINYREFLIKLYEENKSF